MRRHLLVGILLLGCQPDPAPGLDPARRTDVPCYPELAGRCDGADRYQVCREGTWYEEAACAANTVCSVQLGCVACDPLAVRACDGDTVRVCEADGSLGPDVQICAPGGCFLGYCQREDCPAGAELIYVVDRDYRLLSFDPREDAFTFSDLGTLTCPAGPGLGGFGVATPFSMSVDRQGVAWVLYASGELFRVPTNDVGACSKTAWSPGTEGMELFGMGFVADAVGSESETLYIAGGTAEALQLRLPARLAAIDPDDLAVTLLPGLGDAEYPPELTGTGGGDLWAYFPGAFAGAVARVDKATAARAESWPLPGLPGAVRAWAFAHWGGRYFVFISFEDGLGSVRNQVHRFDPATGATDVLLSNSPYRIVGAGVSTCAPYTTG